MADPTSAETVKHSETGKTFPATETNGHNSSSSGTTEETVRPTLFRDPMSRRQLLGRGAKLVGAVALAGALPEILAACGSGTSASSSSGAAAASSTSLPNVNLQLVYLENVQFAGSFFAETKGYYKDAGVNVTLLPGGPNLAPEPIVESGRALVGITHTAEAIQAIINGADLKIIGAGFQKKSNLHRIKSKRAYSKSSRDDRKENRR